jgi:predicted SAM-dependent methyltransferase
MNYLNLGCGKRFCADWTNVDFISTEPEVMSHNLIENIPFSNSSFDVIYHSHFLEHLHKLQAPLFLDECYRVLRPAGVIRVAVPDLEKLMRSYLVVLEQAVSGSIEAAKNYDWLLIEMFDQMIRNFSGGEMANYLFQENIPGKGFILERLGLEAKALIKIGNDNRQGLTSSDFSLKNALRLVNKFIRDSDYRKNIFLRVLLNSVDYQSLKIGQFRQSGEIHQWMYDRYSLANLLMQCGFTGIIQRAASSSYIANWETFNLDTEADGTIYKPDSLYIEAIKPSV